MNSPLHVLFVCTLNQWRSPTAEKLYQNHPQLEVRSAGTRAQARRRLSQSDLAWADVVFVMEREHKAWIREQFQGMELPRIQVLEIPDNLEYMDPELQRILRLSVDPEIEALLKEK